MHIRLATPDDVDLVAEIFRADWLHYFGTAPDIAPTRDHIRDDVLSPGGSEVMLALGDDGEALGMATFAVLYPAPDLTGQLFLKDLFIMAEGRSRGIGTAMLKRLAALALERGCSRLDWTAETDNPAAIDYYDRLGVPRLEEKVYYRLDGARLSAFADNTETDD